MVNVEFYVANYGDMVLAKHGVLPEDQVRSQRLSGVVDSKMTKVILPERLVKQLGLRLCGNLQVSYSDGMRVMRRQADGAYIEIMGRHGIFSAIVEPNRETPLIGAIVLEDFDFSIDYHKHCLVPSNPDGPLFDI